MSGKIMGQVWDLDLDHAELLVLLALTDHADHLGNNIYPSVGLVAWKCGYSERQVQRIIKTLVGYGVLIQVGKTKQGVKSYRVDFTDAKKKPDFSEIRQNVTPIDGDDKMSPQKRQNVTPRGDIAMSPKPSYEPSVINQSLSPATQSDDAVTLPTSGTGSSESVTPATVKKNKRLHTAAIKNELLPILIRYGKGRAMDSYTPSELTTLMKTGMAQILTELQPLDDESPIDAMELDAAFKWFRKQYKDASYPCGSKTVVKMLADYRAYKRSLQVSKPHIAIPALDGLLAQPAPTYADSIDITDVRIMEETE